MSEADILEQLFSLYDRYWVIVQWWASVSFALLLVAHFAADKLSSFLLASIITIYAIYTLWLYFLLDYNLAITFGLLDDLAALGAAGELTQGVREAMEHSSGMYGVWMGMVALPVTFLACSGYLVHAYIHARKGR